MKCYRFLADLAIARHDFRDYRFHIATADSTQATIMSGQTVRLAKEMEAKYETEKKELKIASLEERQRYILLLAIAGGTVLLLALATFFFLLRWTVQKRRLAEQQIKQLEQEKQLIATQALLDGETQERTRLARDLHDGLGSMLTGVKFNLELLKDGTKFNSEGVKFFESAMNILGASALEMRRIAHHLMPDTLIRYGLKAALEDFCASFPIIEFVWFGSSERLGDHQMEVMIYRIVHELVNNALKHSGATKIGVNVMHETDYIAFTVYDNGCGFDREQQTKGTGLQNIRKRVSACNGRIDMTTGAGKGTEVNIELKKL
jgi:signal transduction histidine kinase